MNFSGLYYINEDGLVISFNPKIQKNLGLSLCSKGEFVFNRSIKQRFYLFYHKNRVYVTKRIRSFLDFKRNEISVSLDSSLFYQKFGFIYPPYTLYNNIFLMSPFVGFRIIDGKVDVSTLPFESLKKDDDDPLTYSGINLDAHIKGLLARFVDKSLTQSKTSHLSVLFSGGIDSSVLLALTKDKRHFDCAYTCNMPTLQSEIEKSKLMCEYAKVNQAIIDVPADLECEAERFLEYSLEPIQDNIAPVLSYVYREIGSRAAKKDFNLDSYYLLDGQGADSLLSGLPHDKVYRAYKIISRVPGLRSVLKFLPQSFKRERSRLLYRIFKALSALSAENAQSMLVNALIENKEVNLKSDNRVLSYMNQELNELCCVYDDFHMVIRYFFMFRVLPAREMQKYVNVPSGINILLPFLDDEVVSELFFTPSNKLIRNGIFKAPMVHIAKSHWPSFFSKSKTSPFAVFYKVGSTNIVEYSLTGLKRLVGNSESS
ncbi:hypothetical protein LG272_11025 [Pseudidiomarina marina]|uniref:asparagine synthase-related protein n=1 Tax=Pseudidiomarina marina TaxID=502366 RepID=UPI00384C438A